MVIKTRYCDLCGTDISKQNIFILADFSYIRSNDEKYLGERDSVEICLSCSEKINAYMNTLRGEEHAKSRELRF